MPPPDLPAPRLLPREHGAYAQLGLPLLTVFLVGQVTWAAVLLTLAACAAFLAHGPLFLLVGRRGLGGSTRGLPPAHRRAALRWLIGLAGVGLLSGALGWSGVSYGLSLVWAGGLAAVSFTLLLRGEERSTLGEIVAAAALVALSWPVGDAAGVPAARALTAGWTLAMIGGTWAARVVLEQKRRARGLARRVGPLCALGVAAVVLAQAAPAAGLGALPMLLVGAVAAAIPLPPQTLQRIGWSMAVAGLVSVVIMAAGSAAAGSPLD